MKFSINSVLTTLVGGYPVTTDTTKRAMERLLDENMVLNANLPFVSSRELTKEELVEANVEVKREKIYELCPVLKEEMGEEVKAYGAALASLAKSGKTLSPEYQDICKLALTRARQVVRSRTVSLDFEREVSM